MILEQKTNGVSPNETAVLPFIQLAIELSDVATWVGSPQSGEVICHLRSLGDLVEEYRNYGWSKLG